MGVKSLREAFNGASGGKFTCSDARLSYEQADGKEWQRLTFSGTDAAGAPFTTQSDRLGAGVEVNQAAAACALELVAKTEPKP